MRLVRLALLPRLILVPLPLPHLSAARLSVLRLPPRGLLLVSLPRPRLPLRHLPLVRLPLPCLPAPRLAVARLPVPRHLPSGRILIPRRMRRDARPRALGVLALRSSASRMCHAAERLLLKGRDMQVFL